jgi:hypothetical protein
MLFSRSIPPQKIMAQWLLKASSILSVLYCKDEGCDSQQLIETFVDQQK